jgi:hypothetical protein
MDEAADGDLTEREPELREVLTSLNDAVQHMASEARSRELRRVVRAYRTEANAEVAAARNLFIGMLLLIAFTTVVLAIAASSSITNLPEPNVDTQKFLLICSVSLPALLAIAYMARQSSSRRRRAAEIRRLEKNLLLLDPYLARMNEPPRSLYRALLTQRFFPRSVNEFDAMESEYFPDLDDLMRVLESANSS